MTTTAHYAVPPYALPNITTINPTVPCVTCGTVPIYPIGTISPSDFIASSGPVIHSSVLGIVPKPEPSDHTTNPAPLGGGNPTPEGSPTPPIVVSIPTHSPIPILEPFVPQVEPFPKGEENPGDSGVSTQVEAQPENSNPGPGVVTLGQAGPSNSPPSHNNPPTTTTGLELQSPDQGSMSPSLTAPTPATPAKITLFSQTITANPFSQFVVGSQTLSPGGPAVTILSTPVSLAAAGTAFVVGSSTIALSGGSPWTSEGLGGAIISAFGPGGAGTTVTSSAGSKATAKATTGVEQFTGSAANFRANLRLLHQSFIGLGTVLWAIF